MAMEKQKAPVLRIIIPAFNEEKALPRVLAAIPAGATEVLVVNNGSTDKTAEKAAACGATVVHEPRRGYGSACLAGMAALAADTDIVIFLDGDYSDYPEEIPALIAPITGGRADLVIGSRMLGLAEPGALLPVARFGNWLSGRLLHWGFGIRVTDLGPFRAIRYRSLLELGMRDRNFGWTVEMQAKALARGLKVAEIPVRYRRRIGVSKISGTVKGSVKAGVKILWVIGREWAKTKVKAKSKGKSENQG
jgi:glycosyltransferase involved in cell wall biosynthesis